MVDLLWMIVVQAHVAAAALWVGGNIFFHVAVSPKLKLIPPMPASVLAFKTHAYAEATAPKACAHVLTTLPHTYGEIQPNLRTIAV